MDWSASAKVQVLGLVFRQISPPRQTQTADLGLNPGGDQRIIWLVRCWLINVMRWLWCVLFFCLMSPSWVMHVYDKWHGLDCPIPLRLFVIRPHPLFWSWKNDSIIMLEILPYDLHLDKRITTHKPPISALWLNSSSPPVNLECASCMPSNVDTAYYYDNAFTRKWTHKNFTLCF